MDMEKQRQERALRVSQLIIKHLKEELADQDQAELNSWREEDDNERLFNELTAADELSSLLREYYENAPDTEAALKRIKQRLFAANENEAKG
jgi:hypothetical protein